MEVLIDSRTVKGRAAASEFTPVCRPGGMEVLTDIGTDKDTNKRVNKCPETNRDVE